jgi:hypothetical protein
MASARRESWTGAIAIRRQSRTRWPLAGKTHKRQCEDAALAECRILRLATLQLDANPAVKITEMHLEGEGFTGASTGVIESPDAKRAGAKTLSLKLIPHEGMLVGRILATNSKTVMLPYVLSLNRASA